MIQGLRSSGQFDKVYFSCSDDSGPHQNHRFWVPHKPIRVCSVSAGVRRRGVCLNFKLILIGLLLVLFSTQVYADLTTNLISYYNFDETTGTLLQQGEVECYV